MRTEPVVGVRVITRGQGEGLREERMRGERVRPQELVNLLPPPWTLPTPTTPTPTVYQYQHHAQEPLHPPTTELVHPPQLPPPLLPLTLTPPTPLLLNRTTTLLNLLPPPTPSKALPSNPPTLTTSVPSTLPQLFPTPPQPTLLQAQPPPINLNRISRRRFGQVNLNLRRSVLRAAIQSRVRS